MNIDTSKLKSTHWSELLLQMYSSSDCYDYARTISYKEFWSTCPRGDWLLFFAAKEGSTTHKLIVKAACQCARLSLPYIKAGDLIPLKAIETTELWLEDKATIEEVKLAAHAAYADATNVYAANPAAYSAYYASYASASAAYAYAYFAADAATAATDVAYATASYTDYITSAAAYAAANTSAVKKEMQQKTADIVRSIIPMPTQAVNEFERLVKMKAFW